jgi:hypothetical protein
MGGMFVQPGIPDVFPAGLRIFVNSIARPGKTNRELSGKIA